MTMNRRWIAACAVAAVVTGMGILAGGDVRAADKAGEKDKPAVGKTWPKFFSDGLVDAEGKRVSLKDLKGKLVGVYFSAHWCPPCKIFTPKLVAFRDKNTADFEVVFVSSDRSQQAKDAYMKEAKMKWPTVPFRSKSGAKLKTDYGVRGIPTLIVLSPKGNTVSTIAPMEVTIKPDTCIETWKAAAAKADKE